MLAKEQLIATNSAFSEQFLTHLADGEFELASALHLLAARGTGKAAIRALVEAGADINAKDNEGKTALDIARLVKRKTAEFELKSLGAK